MHASAIDALSSSWLPTLDEEGITEESAQLWLATRRDTLKDNHVHAVWRRLEGATVTQLSQELGLERRRAHTILHRAALRLFLPHLEHVPGWRRAHDDGADVAVIADAFDIDPRLIDLALNGWPPRTARSAPDLAQAHQRWTAGEAFASVAAALDLTRAQLIRECADDRSILAPPRLLRRQVEQRLGWQHAVLSRYIRLDHFPAPDGIDGNTSWWWESNVESWIDTANLRWCPECQRAFLGDRGRRGHITRIHSPPASQSE